MLDLSSAEILTKGVHWFLGTIVLFALGFEGMTIATLFAIRIELF